MTDDFTMGIVATGMYLPETIMTAEEIADASGLPLWVVKEKLGITQKHIPKPGLHPNMMAVEAANQCLAKADVDPKEIDEVVKATVPDVNDIDSNVSTTEADLFYHHNSLGSVVAVTNGSGTVVEEYSYTAYGELTVDTKLGTTTGTGTATRVAQPFGFTGRRHDYEEGSPLLYFRLRYYDPVAGRFVSRDPLGLWGDPAQRGSGQSYCGANPVNLVDPLGLKEGDYSETEVYTGGGTHTEITTWYAPPHLDTSGCSEEEKEQLEAERTITRKSVVYFVDGIIRSVVKREYDHEIVLTFDRSGRVETVQTVRYEGQRNVLELTKWKWECGCLLEKQINSETTSYTETYEDGKSDPVNVKEETSGPAGDTTTITTELTNEGGKITTETVEQGGKVVKTRRFHDDPKGNRVEGDSYQETRNPDGSTTRSPLGDNEAAPIPQPRK